MAGEPPNVLLITTDTQRWDTLRCAGSLHARSPHLDRLAAEGTRFTDAYTACPVCMPARCSLITGTHTQTHGAIENGIVPRTHLATLPSLLHDAGYSTIMVGKNHVGPLDPGYDRECIIVGEKGNAGADPYTAFLVAHGHDRGDVAGALPAALHMETFLVDQTIAALDAVREERPDRPFFAHCSLLSPHDPIDPPSPWDTLYDGIPLPDVNYRPGELDEHPAMLHEVFGLRHRTDVERMFTPGGDLDLGAVDAHRRRYYGLAAFCDHQVGRLIDHLDESGLRATTLVIFTSDHGTQLFDHGFNDKHCYFDASWRVPLIVSMPGRVPEGEQRQFASWVDIAPSVLAAAGITCNTMQGFDLFTPLVTGETNPRRHAASTLYTSSALVTDRWKLEWYAEEGAGRLYDRTADGIEQEDLFASRQHRSIREALLHALLAWRTETQDVQWLRENTHRGGPVARNVADHTRHLGGNDAERRLGHRLTSIEFERACSTVA